MAHHSLQSLFLLAVLVFLPPAVNSQVSGIPTINLEATTDSSGSVKYSAKLKLALQPGATPEEAGFLLDLKAQKTVLSFNCTRKTTKAELWSLVTGDGGIVASTADTLVGSIDVVCQKKHGKNIAALSASPSSLPSQVVSKLDQRPLRFATVLFESSGTLYFGRISWVQFTSIVPERREDVIFVNIPLKLAPSGGYLLELTGIGSRTSLAAQKVDVEMSTSERFTSLPSKLYQFIVGQFHREATEKKITPAVTSYGKLTRCYNMKAEDRKSFRNVTMVFSGKSQWSVSGEEYLVQKPGSGNVYCFAFVEAAAGHPGVIGTTQQLRRVVEYQLDNKTLSVSLPLVGGLISP